ncbi:hypothetical protein FACS189490_13560 [Clostridia bacterium]|nr:hypothetical protein FACS189490_13560 [Clostridia bacterium]
MNKKTFITVAAVAVLLLILIAVILRVLTATRQNDAPNDTGFAATTENNRTAGQILNWLDTSMRDERGAYNTFYNCAFGEDTQPVCDNGNSSNRTGMAVMWANYSYFQATGDTAAMDRLARDIATYANRGLVNIIQTDDLSCFYMEPIVNSSHTGIDREVARKICLDTLYEMSLTGEGRYNFTDDTLEAHRDNADRLIASITGETTISEPPTAETASPSAVNSVVIDGFWATWAADHAARYLVNNEVDTLIDAYFFFAGALTEYRENRAIQADINRSYELLLASSQMCGLVDDKDNASCQFTAWLDKKLEEMPIADGSPELEAVVKCALANTENRDRYIDFLSNYYASAENNYYQFEQTKLLNEYGGLSKNVVTNALFAGLLAGH